MSSNSQAARQLKGVAAILMVLAGCSVAYHLLAILGGLGTGIGTASGFKNLGLGDRFGAIAANSFGTVALPIISLMAAVNVFYGALKMYRFENYRWALAAAAISLIPCISPCYFLGIPFGIWALVLMKKDQVKRAFPP